MLSSASSRRNKPSSTRTTTAVGDSRRHETTTTKRKLRTRTRAMKRKVYLRQNFLVGMLVIAIVFSLVTIGSLSSYTSNLDNYQNIELNVDRNLRGGDNERSIWVSEKSQPFVSVSMQIIFISSILEFSSKRTI